MGVGLGDDVRRGIVDPLLFRFSARRTGSVFALAQRRGSQMESDRAIRGRGRSGGAVVSPTSGFVEPLAHHAGLGDDEAPRLRPDYNPPRSPCAVFFWIRALS